MYSLIKYHSQFILLLLVSLLLLTPLFSVEAEYFTGYLDFDFYNLNNIRDSRINTAFSFFLENEAKNDLYYILKYDSEKNNNYNLTGEHFWLDRSISLKDLSRQNKYLKVKYNNSKILYGKYKVRIDSSLFYNYYNNFHGLKFTHGNKKSRANIFVSRSNQISITDRIFNPSYSIIFLSNKKVLQGSETIYVNTLNKDNEVLNTSYLQSKLHYEIDYLSGKVTFDPLIYFLNKPKYNRELIINYKIKDMGLNYLNRGYILSTEIMRNTALKIYKVKEENQKSAKGLVISLSPDEQENYRLEYQQEQEKKRKIYMSNDHGANYIKNESKDKREKKIGIKYFNEINSDNKIEGHSYKTIIKAPVFKELIKFENYVKLNNKLNEKINSEIIYRNSVNSLNQKNYQYQANINSQIKQGLILNTRFKYKNGASGSKREKTLENFFDYKYSEYLDIFWGYYHNMPKNLYYGQYKVRYKPKNNSHILFRNKVLNTEYREKRFEYKTAKGIKMFKTIQKNLNDKRIVKSSKGLKYKINKESSISFINNTHKKDIKNKENIFKVKLDFNKNISAGLNRRTYYKNINGVFQNKRRATKFSLNIKNDINSFSSSFDKERNIADTFKKKRIKVSYHKRNIPRLYIFTGFENEVKKDKIKNIADVYSNLQFKVKYRPLNNNNIFSYSYLKQKVYTKNPTVNNKEDSINQTIDLTYFMNTKVSFNTSFSKLEKRLKTTNRSISNVILLKRFGLNYGIKKNWSIKGEYRRLVKNEEKIDSGYLISIRKHLNKKLSLGIEYNFTDFNNELNDLSYNNKGLSLNANYKW